MNKLFLNTILAGTLTLALAGCGENTWNDHYLDGFEGGVNYDKGVEGEYTLTPADYKAISKLMEAKATTEDEKTAAKAIASNQYFEKNGIYPASVALIPFFETQAFPYYLAGNGSQVTVAYAEVGNVPEELTKLAGADAYTLAEADYIEAWGSDDNYIKGFAPATPASKFVPGILAAKFPGAESGNYAVVTYQEASVNPVFGNVGGEEKPKVYIDFTFADGQGDFTIENIQLPEGSSYVWKHDTYKGDSYMKASAFVNKEAKVSDAWVISPEVKLQANANAVLTVDQAWKNFKDLETAKQQATICVREAGGQWNVLSYNQFPTNADYNFVNTGKIDLGAYNGKTIQIGFHYVSTTESCGTYEFKNVILCDAAAYPESTPATVKSRAAAAEVPTEGVNAVYTFDGAKWIVADNANALNPADYTAMGFKNNKLSQPEVFIPLYLKSKLPYAMDGDKRYVVYNGTKADLFIYNGSAWVMNNNEYEDVRGLYRKTSGNWAFIKYMGKAVYSPFEEDKIRLERSYIFVYGDACNDPVSKDSNFGYLLKTTIAITNGTITLPTDVNAITFTAFGNDDIKAPEGTFFMKDSYGRFMYNDTGRSNFSVTETVTMNGDKIFEGYLWRAQKLEDGNWKVYVDRSTETEEVYNMVLYSTKYNNFAAYRSQSADDMFPTLFILE